MNLIFCSVRQLQRREQMTNQCEHVLIVSGRAEGSCSVVGSGTLVPSFGALPQSALYLA
jgi:hypothetical protein